MKTMGWYNGGAIYVRFCTVLTFIVIIYGRISKGSTSFSTFPVRKVSYVNKSWHDKIMHGNDIFKQENDI